MNDQRPVSNDHVDAPGGPGEPPDVESGRPVATSAVAAPVVVAPSGVVDDADPRRSVRPRGGAALALVALLVALGFGAGFLAGRGTAPGTTAASGGTGIVAGGTPGVSSSPASPSPDASGQGGASSGAPSSPNGASPSASSVSAGLPSDGRRLGRADAKVTMDVWADYQCPFCRKFVDDVMPGLRSRIAEGTLAVAYHDYAFLGQESLDASVATRCADRQGRYWAMHDALYAAQAGENEGAFARPKLDAIATAVGLDAKAFTSCSAERLPLLDVLDDTATGVRAGIASTPTIEVAGARFQGVPDATKLTAAIDAAAAGTASASPSPSPSASAFPDPWAGVTKAGRSAGSSSAPVTVELWTDYQSAGSPAIVNEIEPELRKRAEAGKVRVVLRDLATLGDESISAASVVRCTDAQGGPAWFVHDVLATNAQGQGSGIYVRDNLLRFASRLGLRIHDLDACLDDPATRAAIDADTAAGSAKGLKGGPAVVVLRGSAEVARFTGTPKVADVTKAIDKAVAAAG